MTKENKILDRRFVPAHQTIIQQGTLGNRAYYIESGRVEIFMHDKKGRDIKIAEAVAGAIIGEMALFSDGVRSASIRTLEDSVLIGISCGDLERSWQNTDDLSQKILSLLVKRLRETNDKLIHNNMELADLEAAANLTVQNISMQIPQEEQTAFKQEVLPLLDRLKSTLEKYQRI